MCERVVILVSEEVLCCACLFFIVSSSFLMLELHQFVIQAICDHRGIFTSYEIGWPGSVTDATVFKESDMWLRKADYFEDDEYILVDKGFHYHELKMKTFSHKPIDRLPTNKILDPSIC